MAADEGPEFIGLTRSRTPGIIRRGSPETPAQLGMRRGPSRPHLRQATPPQSRHNAHGTGLSGRTGDIDLITTREGREGGQVSTLVGVAGPRRRTGGAHGRPRPDDIESARRPDLYPTMSCSSGWTRWSKRTTPCSAASSNWRGASPPAGMPRHAPAERGRRARPLGAANRGGAGTRGGAGRPQR